MGYSAMFIINVLIGFTILCVLIGVFIKCFLDVVVEQTEFIQEVETHNRALGYEILV